MIKCTYENGKEVSLRHAVVDMLLEKDEKILLVKRAGKLLESGKWALVGGFVERDETLVEAAKREVKEESGWETGAVKLFRIVDNPDRRNEDRQNISFVFICEATQKTGESDHEVDETKWFELDNLPEPDQIAFDHLEHINLFKEYLKGNLNLLPIIDNLNN